MKRNIIFIGMPAVGKSKVGFAVARRLRMKFIDTDILIKKQEQRTLKEIIAEEGEEGFLAIENQVNRDLKAFNAVISPGGSIVYCTEAMEHFKKIGTVVYLEASYDTIRSRIRSLTKRGVVLKEGQTFRKLYHERVKLYKQYADVVINEDGNTIEDTIENVIKELRKYWHKKNHKHRHQRKKGHFYKNSIKTVKNEQISSDSDNNLKNRAVVKKP